VASLFPSNEEDVDEETEFPASFQMSMFQELAGKHPPGCLLKILKPSFRDLLDKRLSICSIKAA
jgi:hypothetical protein